MQELDSLVALRLALKVDETQIYLYEGVRKEGVEAISEPTANPPSSPYQKILDLIVGTLFRTKQVSVIRRGDQSTTKDKISESIQDREVQICESLGWNLNQLTGYDFLKLILKASNQNYDFSNLINLVEQTI